MASGVGFFFLRVFTRTGRISLGIVLGAVAIWMAVQAYELLSRTLATATLFSIVGGLGAGWLAVMLGVASLLAAFGEGKTHKQYEDEIETKAKRAESARIEVVAEEAKRLSEVQRWPVWRQVLFDATFPRRRPRIYYSVVAAGFSVIGLVIAVLLLNHN